MSFGMVNALSNSAAGFGDAFRMRA